MRVLHIIARIGAGLIGVFALVVTVITVIALANNGNLFRDFVNGANSFNWAWVQDNNDKVWFKVIVLIGMALSGVLAFLICIKDNKICNILFICFGLIPFFTVAWFYGLPYFIIGGILLITPSNKLAI